MERSGWHRPSERAKKRNEEAREFFAQRGITVPKDIALPLRKKDQDYFAIRIKEKEREISDGVILRAKSIELGDGCFTNSYDLCVNEDVTNTLEIRSTQKPQYLHKIFHDKNVYAAINAGFFYLSDGPESGPADASFNLCIRDGHVISLPARTSQVLIQGENGLEAHTLDAYGNIIIGEQEIAWVGAHAKKTREYNGVLYNSACCHIYYDRDTLSNSEKRLFDQQRNMTPTGPDLCDIIVNTVGGNLHVVDVRYGGGTDFFAGNFIIQCSTSFAEKIKVGDKVNPQSVGGIALNNIQSAISVGESISAGNDDNLDALAINSDQSLGNTPFLDRRFARAVLYKDESRVIHMRIFDGVRGSKYFDGATPREISDIIKKEHGAIEWGVHLDGGRSARMIIKDEKYQICEPYGNLQYTRWPIRALDRTDRYYFDLRGRKVASSICLVKHSL